MGQLIGNLAASGLDRSARIDAIFDGDERTDKWSFAADVCHSPDGKSLEFEVVRDAKKRLQRDGSNWPLDEPSGDIAFHALLTRLLLGDDAPTERFARATAAGGRGALRLAFELFREAHPETTIWVPKPGRWHHSALAKELGLNCRYYRYTNPEGTAVDLPAILQDLGVAAPGDVILLQAAGHDPTGLDLPPEAWAALSALCLETNAIPLADVAFTGLARAISKDMDGLHGLLMAVPEAIVTVSGSWMFGLHRERVGMLLVQAETQQDAGQAQGRLDLLSRMLVGSPADHGPRIASSILSLNYARDAWFAELALVRQRLGEIRTKLFEALSNTAPDRNWNMLTTGIGLYTLLPLNDAERQQLWTKHGYYLSPDGRLNLTSLRLAQVSPLAEAIAACLGAVPEPEVLVEPEAGAEAEAVAEPTAQTDGDVSEDSPSPPSDAEVAASEGEDGATAEEKQSGAA